MSKTKPKSKSRKEMENQINNMGGALHRLFSETDAIKKGIVGVETMILYYAEFSGKRKEYEEFLSQKIEEGMKKQEEVEKKAREKQVEDLTKEVNKEKTEV